jgi:hypothetical protein
MGRNDASMHASCTRCGLKTSTTHKKTEHTDAVTELNRVHLVELAPGLVMMTDTGCRAAVGGGSGIMDYKND